MLQSDVELLKHIHDECLFILKYTKECSFEDFIDDEVLTKAIERSLEILGEASKKLDSDFKLEHPEIEWKKLSALRNIIIHNYSGVDYAIVWEIIRNDAPELEFQIHNILKTNNLYGANN